MKLKPLLAFIVFAFIWALLGCGQDSLHLISEVRADGARIKNTTVGAIQSINFEEYGENVCQAVKQTLMDNGMSATCATLADWREMNRGASHERASL